MAIYKDITELKKQIADFKKAINSPNSDYMTGYLSALSATEGIIAALPTADVVEVKHGEWIYRDSDIGWKCYECSSCNTIHTFYDEDSLSIYCSQCGAKMDGRK